MQIIMQLGLTMAGCIIFCFIAGQAIDRWIGTKGIFITIFIIFGVIGGGVVVYRQIFEIIGESDSSEDSNNGTPKTD
ncbi:MAG: AtpZ/AtpI family protein [Desulfococcaceae bacterium]|nr:AtpZ/AtpI family protein [Desulfococcaceae bacterium]